MQHRSAPPVVESEALRSHYDGKVSALDDRVQGVERYIRFSYESLTTRLLEMERHILSLKRHNRKAQKRQKRNKRSSKSESAIDGTDSEVSSDGTDSSDDDEKFAVKRPTFEEWDPKSNPATPTGEVTGRKANTDAQGGLPHVSQIRMKNKQSPEIAKNPDFNPSTAGVAISGVSNTGAPPNDAKEITETIRGPLSTATKQDPISLSQPAPRVAPARRDLPSGGEKPSPTSPPSEARPGLEKQQSFSKPLQLRSIQRSISRGSSFMSEEMNVEEPTNMYDKARRMSKRMIQEGKSIFSLRVKVPFSPTKVIPEDSLRNLDPSVVAEMNHLEAQMSKNVIRVNSKLRQYWESLIAFLVMYELAVIPIVTSFKRVDLHESLDVLDYIVYVCFCWDLLLNFVTTHYNGEQEVTDYAAIAKRYVGSKWFWIDVVSCFPAVFIENEGHLPVNSDWLRIVRLLRLVRVGKLYKQFEDVTSSSLYRLMRLLIFIGYNIHWGACMWNGVVSDLLIDRVDGGDEEREIITGVFARYTFCVWCSCSFLLGLGALNPVTVPETYVATWFSIYGACLQACVFGSVAVLIAGLDAEETQFQRKIFETAQRLRGLSLPNELRKRVLSYYSMLWQLNRAGSGNIDSFVGELSPSLQIDIRLCLFREMITKIPFFSNDLISPVVVEALVMRLHTMVYLQGDIIIRKGENGDWMGFIGRGGKILTVSLRSSRTACLTSTRRTTPGRACLSNTRLLLTLLGKIAILDPSSEERRPIKILYEGDYVGEIALLFNLKRTASVEAFTLVRMHVLTQTDYDEVMQTYVADAKILRSEMEKYFITQKRFTEAQLKDMKAEAEEKTRVRERKKSRSQPSPKSRERGLSLFDKSKTSSYAGQGHQSDQQGSDPM